MCVCRVLSSLGFKDLRRGVHVEMVRREEFFRPMSIEVGERRYSNMYYMSCKRRACGRVLTARKGKIVVRRRGGGDCWLVFNI